MPAPKNTLNLANVFKTVAGALSNQKDTLNQADTYNHDHGDNMVDTFNVIAQAMQAKRNAPPADQLEYASQLLRQRKSGSAQVYAQGLSQASKEFQGKKQVTPDNAMTLIQALMGGGQAQNAQPQAGMGDLLGSLLGGNQASTQQQQPGTGDLLNMLMGGQSNTQSTGQPDAGIDAGDLLNAGLAFMNTKSKGGNNMEAIVNALVSSSALGNTSHRAQSSTLVINTLMQALGGMLNKK